MELYEFLNQIEQREYAIIFITEDIVKKFTEEIDSFYKETLPAVLVIPGIKGASVLGKEGLKKILERALGSDILENN